jgi:antitoxin FitA
MFKMIQIRNVPEPLHRKLKARAAEDGLTLSDFLLREAQRAAQRPSLSELRERLAGRTPVTVRERPARLIRRERDRR